MLTDIQIWSLAKKMNVPLVFCDFKSKLTKTKLQYNKFYILNMEDEFDEDGKPNDGSHYVALQCNKYPNGKIENCYFDSFGAPPPEVVIKFCGGGHVPYNTKDIQSLMNSACGFYCLAWGHFINAYEQRSKDLYSDCENFTEMFDDLNKSIDFKKNEYILKMFFQSSDKAIRDANPIDVLGELKPGEAVDINTITSQDIRDKKHL